MKKSMSVLTAVAAAAVFSAGVQAGTVDDVKRKGFVQCGVSQGLPGFSNPDTQGNWTGLDVDVCRAIAAAVLGNASKVKYSPLSAKERFTALQSGEVDVLSRNTTWTLVRDTALGLNFAGVNYYDGQGFMVRKDLGVKSAIELDGASVCVNIGTTTELNLSDYFRANNMKFKPVVFEKADEVVQAYDGGRCDVYTTDQSGLAAQRIKLKDPDAHMILPEVISKEPLGPVVRHGDDQWLDVVKWTLYAMLEAEELGVTSKNVDKMKGSSNPTSGVSSASRATWARTSACPTTGATTSSSRWATTAKVFDMHVGPKTTLQLPRGVNNLWNKGGLQYPMPVR